MIGRPSRAAALVGLVAAASAGLGRAARAEPNPAESLERELEGATKVVGLATVFCVAKGVPAGGDESGSSGVLVTRSGYVLSDADAGAYFVPKPGARREEHEKKYADEVEVRVPDAKRKFTAYVAKVVARAPDVDSSLLKIASPPPSGFPFVPPGTAQDLRVGAYAFALGTPFGHDEGGAAAQTLGVVSALVPASETGTGGRWSEIYTSAAVNPGVNGGPLVDAEGALVGIVSTWGNADPKNPFQFLGKVFPIDRVRDAYRSRPESAEVFREAKPAPRRSKQAEMLEIAYGVAAQRAFRSVVSLEIRRDAPLVMQVGSAEGRPLVLPRYAGPVSGLALSKDGWIVTSLYNLGNVTSLARSTGPGDLERGVAGVKGATLWLPDGTSAPARLVSHDQRLAVACFKADLPAGTELVPVEAAPASSIEVGRMVLCVGNPFGGSRPENPLLTVGVCSRVHPCDCDSAWRGTFQTDAGVTDGNVGGALVDVHGRVLGMATLWDPAMQGRSSGIGFGIPLSRILAALPVLQGGTCVKLGFLGVVWSREARGSGVARSITVSPDGPAAKAGMKDGDVIVEIDGKKVEGPEDVGRGVRAHDVGDSMKVVVMRESERVELVVTLGEAPLPPP